ncbi:MAG: hypothetical protein ACE5HB_03470 [Terriglobia bacterium]
MRYFESQPAEKLKFQSLLYSKADSVACITINRPKAYNAYNTPRATTGST